ncbi:MAG: TetR/AcrR family transcriptional regulator [Methylocystaceae bacterium]|nr:TetR/AcrR family transcriptional regulator [Methylocystaceae bacterium]
MVQILKEEVRERILQSAERLFVLLGYQKATMNAIADDANMAVGNIYKYFPSKQKLFHAIIDDEFVSQLRSLTLERVKSLNDPSQIEQIKSIDETNTGKLLDFWITNRNKTIILLARSKGSKYEEFAKEYVQLMIDFSNAQLPVMRPNLTNTEMFQFVFKNRIEDTVRDIVLILEKYETDAEIKRAFATSWSYHYAGIQGLIEWSSRHEEGSC